MENVEIPKRSLTVCGKTSCQCSIIMAHLEESRTPFFFANNNFTRRRGPRVPDEFVQEHGHEMYDHEQVTLEAAGKYFAVELKISSKDPGIIRMGLGWENFILRSKLQTEDLLFFTLEGQSRFAVIVVRGHNRRIEAETEVEPQKKKGKHGDVVESDHVREEKEEETSQLGAAAKKPNLGENSKPEDSPRHPAKIDSGDERETGATSKEPKNPVNIVVDLSSDSEPSDQGTKYVTPITSEDAFGNYMLLDSSDSGNSASDSDEYSNFEDESDFKENFSE